MTIKAFLLLLSFSFFLSFKLEAQHVARLQLSGKVTDRNSGLPLAGATVSLVDARLTAVTDSAGFYLLKNIPLGHTIIEISYIGYGSLAEHLDITHNIVFNFSLSAAIIENEGVVVTAVGNAISAKRSPVSISRVSRIDLLSASGTNIIDALTRQPGLSQVSTGPAISKPVIRGLGYNRLVVINDGLRQEGQQWGDEHGIEIDENSVQQVEIVKGPASLIYGSDALAGVINIVTNKSVPANSIHGNLMSCYMTNNRQRSLYANISGNLEGFSWNVWGDRKAAADYRNKYDGYVYNSKFNEANFGGYAGITGSRGFSHLTISSFDQNVGIIEGERDLSGQFIKLLPGGALENPDITDFNSIHPQLPYQHIRHFRLISDNSFRMAKGKINLLAGFQRNRRMEFGDPDMPSVPGLFFDLRTFNYRLSYQFNDRSGWSNSAGVGGMQQDNYNRAEEVIIPAYSLFDIGGYFYSQKTINETSLSGGLRWDLRQINTKAFNSGGQLLFGAMSRRFSNVSGSIGVSHSFSHQFLMKLNLARGFRAPSISELTSNGVHEGTNRFEFGDPDLQSESSLQADLAAELATDHFIFSVTAFINSIDGFIYYSRLLNSAGIDSVVEVNNEFIPAYKYKQQGALLSGFEMKIDLHPHPVDWLHLESTVSFVRGNFTQQLEGTRNMPLMPAPRILTELRAELLKSGKCLRDFSVFIEWDQTFSQNNPFTAYGTETKTAGYGLFNAGFHGNINKGKKTAFSVFFIASNISDLAYQNHLSRLKYTDENTISGRQGVFNIGRNFTIKINIPLSFNASQRGK